MMSFVSSISVSRDIDTVFDFITDIANVEAIFEYISDVTPITRQQGTVHGKYRQTRRLHGINWPETVEVVACEKNTKYTLCVLIFGVVTLYIYKFVPLSSNTTCIQLTKEMHAEGFRKLLLPLVHHVLTRPEHDGKHLNILKSAIEQL